MTKIMAALFTSLVLSGFLGIMSLIESDGYLFLLIVFFLSLFGNIVYGVPVSFLSDFLSKRLLKGRVVFAGFLHIFFGFITFYVIEGYAFFAVICAVLFFIIDEWLKSTMDGKRGRERWLIFGKTLIVVPFAAIAFWAMSMYSSLDKTNNIYLIPEGYEGSVVIFYNVPGEPPLGNEGDFSVIPLEVDSLPALLGTDIEEYATYRTSTRESATGIINNQYYYVDSKGNRTEIERYCTHLGASGSSAAGNERILNYEIIQITSSDCGEDFYHNGKMRFSEQTREILNYWLSYD